MLLLWEVAWITTLQGDKIKVLHLYLMLPAFLSRALPGCVSAAHLEWCHIGTWGVDLVSQFQQKQSTALVAMLLGQVILQHLKKLITWLLSKSHLVNYPASQTYSAKYKTNYMFKFWSLSEVKLLSVIGPKKLFLCDSEFLDTDEIQKNYKISIYPNWAKMRQNCITEIMVFLNYPLGNYKCKVVGLKLQNRK